MAAQTVTYVWDETGVRPRSLAETPTEGIVIEGVSLFCPVCGENNVGDPTQPVIHRVSEADCLKARVAAK